jgi:transcriptional regulator with GAF, ATPase, and Fis domain
MLTNTAAAIADKYVAKDGGPPKPSAGARPLELSNQEARWLRKAISRQGWMPYKLRDGDDSPSVQKRRSMADRGLISGPPWRITAYGREAIKKFEEVKRKALAALPPIVTARTVCTLAEVERAHILNILDHCRGNRSQAARLLGISLRTVRNKLRSYAETI